MARKSSMKYHRMTDLKGIARTHGLACGTDPKTCEMKSYYNVYHPYGIISVMVLGDHTHMAGVDRSGVLHEEEREAVFDEPHLKRVIGTFVDAMKRTSKGRKPRNILKPKTEELFNGEDKDWAGIRPLERDSLRRRIQTAGGDRQRRR